MVLRAVQASELKYHVHSFSAISYGKVNDRLRVMACMHTVKATSQVLFCLTAAWNTACETQRAGRSIELSQPNSSKESTGRDS